MLKHTITRVEKFNAAHKLENKSWSSEKNLQVFGLCNNPNFHGHNYKLLVSLTGNVNEDTGYLIDLKILSKIVKENVIERFDHKNLNIDCPEFEKLNPTTENIATVIYNLLKPNLDPELTLTITLYETEKNFVTYPI